MKNSLERLGSIPATDQDGKIHTVDVYRRKVSVSFLDGKHATAQGSFVLRLGTHAVEVIDPTHVEVPETGLKLTLARSIPT